MRNRMHPVTAVVRRDRTPAIPRGHVGGQRRKIHVETALPDQTEVRKDNALVDSHVGKTFGARRGVPIVAGQLLVVHRVGAYSRSNPFFALAELRRLPRQLHIDG
jgi:hypothetical protein